MFEKLKEKYQFWKLKRALGKLNHRNRLLPADATLTMINSEDTIIKSRKKQKII